MKREIESGDLTIWPWPDRYGDLAIGFAKGAKMEWMPRTDVLTTVKELIKNFKITEDELNDDTK